MIVLTLSLFCGPVHDQSILVNADKLFSVEFLDSSGLFFFGIDVYKGCTFANACHLIAEHTHIFWDDVN
jgi:hypothetical protein